MACKIANLVAFILCAAAAFSALFSLEPKTIGGVIKKVNRDPDMSGDQSQWLYHPFYLSYTHDRDGEVPPEDSDICLGWAEQDDYGADNSYIGFPFGSGRGLTKKPSCRINILHATGEAVNMQRAYAAIILGGFNGALRRWWFRDEADVFDVLNNSSAVSDNLYNSGTNNGVGGEVVNNMLDVTFRLVQTSGAFLALGIALNVLALVMGGFIWKLSDKCNYGPCALLFNSTMLASFSVICYMVSVGAFVMVFYQGQEVNSDQPVDTMSTFSDDYTNGSGVKRIGVIETEYKTKYSIGGILIIGAIVLELFAIGLAAWQWMMDKRNAGNGVQVVQVPNAPQYNV